MKKALLVFLGLLALNATIFPMGNEQDAACEAPQTQLTEVDKAKVAAASFGGLCFGGTALMAGLTIYQGELLGYYNPAAYAAWPFFKVMVQVMHCDENEFTGNICLGAGGVISGAVACVFGAYVYKKLSVLRSNKQPKKDT